MLGLLRVRSFRLFSFRSESNKPNNNNSAESSGSGNKKIDIDTDKRLTSIGTFLSGFGAVLGVLMGAFLGKSYVDKETEEMKTNFVKSVLKHNQNLETYTQNLEKRVADLEKKNCPEREDKVITEEKKKTP